MSWFASPSYWRGAYVRKFSPAVAVPVISLPAIVTLSTWPESTIRRNSLNVTVRSRAWKFVETFQITTPTAINAIQNSKLLSLVFTLLPLLAGPLSRLSRLAYGR